MYIFLLKMWYIIKDLEVGKVFDSLHTLTDKLVITGYDNVATQIIHGALILKEI